MSLRYIVRLISQLDLWICRDRQSRSTLHRRGSGDKKKEVPSSEVALCGVSGPWLVERPRTLLSLVELARVLTALPHHHLPPLFSIIVVFSFSRLRALSTTSLENHLCTSTSVVFEVADWIIDDMWFHRWSHTGDRTGLQQTVQLRISVNDMLCCSLDNVNLSEKT